MGLPIITVVSIGQCRGGATLCHHGVRLAEQRFADYRGLCALAAGLDGGAQTGTTGADYDDIEFM